MDSHLRFKRMLTEPKDTAKKHKQCIEVHSIHREEFPLQVTEVFNRDFPPYSGHIVDQSPGRLRVPATRLVR